MAKCEPLHVLAEQLEANNNGCLEIFARFDISQINFQSSFFDTIMGRVYLTYFDQTPETRFYLCGDCPAHIALPQEFLDNLIDNELAGGVFRNVVNVHTLSPEQDRMVGACTLSDVYCNNCGNLLGVKFIEVANDDDGAVRAGYFLLRRKKLREWNGQEIVARNH